MKRARYRQPMVLFVLCGLVGWLGLMGVPAGAHVPPDNNVNFNPDEFNGNGGVAVGNFTKEAEIPSDAEDGFGTTYELRAVSDSQTAFYEWYDCADGGNPGVPAGAPGCAPIATDTTGDSAPTPPGEGAALSFTGSYNVPSTSDHPVAATGRDWYGIACAADANTGGPPFDTSHCIPNDVAAAPFEGTGCAFGGQTCVDSLHPDDAQTTGDHAATTSGRIANFIQPGRNFSQVEAHGAGLKNGDALTVIAFTSAGGVDAVHVCMDQFSDDEMPNDGNPGGGPNGNGGGCTHNGTDTSPTPGGGSGCHAQAPTAAGGDCWAVTIGVPNANTVFGVSLIEIDDINIIAGGTGNAEGATFGTGDCAGGAATAPIASSTAGDDCQLDKVYVTTTSAGEGAAPPPTPPPGPPGPPTPPRPPARNLCDPNRAGANGNELILGTRGPDQLCGFGGDDTLRGKRGRDTLRGGPGNDVLGGAKGQDNLRGGSGDDSMRGGRGRDTLRGASGSDVARGGKGKDLCRAENRSSCER